MRAKRAAETLATSQKFRGNINGRSLLAGSQRITRIALLSSFTLRLERKLDVRARRPALRHQACHRRATIAAPPNRGLRVSAAESWRRKQACRSAVHR
jgi:hypothetical protein